MYIYIASAIANSLRFSATVKFHTQVSQIGNKLNSKVNYGLIVKVFSLVVWVSWNFKLLQYLG